MKVFDEKGRLLWTGKVGATGPTGPAGATGATGATGPAGTGIVSGIIAMWHGLIANIPAGYVICDGNNSTPNLLAKFVEGVATAATDPGATGGEAAHVLTVAELAAHTHTFYKRGGSGNLYPADSTGLDPSDTSSTGGDSAHENRPPYYDIAFIMKTQR